MSRLLLAVVIMTAATLMTRAAPFASFPTGNHLPSWVSFRSMRHRS